MIDEALAKHRLNSSSCDRCNGFKRICVKCSREKAAKALPSVNCERQISVSVARSRAAGFPTYAAILCRERKPRASKIGIT